ncbi:hypothetical protein E4U33_007590, partial [Claviceps sp. LM78 group G4]
MAYRGAQYKCQGQFMWDNWQAMGPRESEIAVAEAWERWAIRDSGLAHCMGKARDENLQSDQQANNKV